MEIANSANRRLVRGGLGSLSPASLATVQEKMWSQENVAWRHVVTEYGARAVGIPFLLENVSPEKNHQTTGGSSLPARAGGHARSPQAPRGGWPNVEGQGPSPQTYASGCEPKKNSLGPWYKQATRKTKSQPRAGGLGGHKVGVPRPRRRDGRQPHRHRLQQPLAERHLPGRRDVDVHRARLGWLRCGRGREGRQLPDTLGGACAPTWAPFFCGTSQHNPATELNCQL